MSELTVKIRDAAHDDSLFDKWVHKLCDEHERLEAMLRAWATEGDDSDEFHAVWEEALRLAKEG